MVMKYDQQFISTTSFYSLQHLYKYAVQAKMYGVLWRTRKAILTRSNTDTHSTSFQELTHSAEGPTLATLLVALLDLPPLRFPLYMYPVPSSKMSVNLPGRSPLRKSSGSVMRRSGP